MTKLIQEPSSQRSDNLVWVWQYADPVFCPIKVSLRSKSSEEVYATIPVDFYVEFFIKSDLRNEDAVISKVFKFVAPSVFVVDIPTSEVTLLRAGKHYYVGMALYDERGEFVRTLVADLPLRVEKSVLSKSVF